MDDTVWHCEASETMQNILNDTNKLYTLSNIQINTSKSDLLYLPSKNKTNKNQNITTQTPLLLNNLPLYPRKPEEIIRYLGIFYNGLGSPLPTLNAITDKIENFLTIIRFKKLTPIQFSTLFNTILSPSLEYMLQILPLTHSKSLQLSRLLTIQTKKLIHLSKNTNNIILTNPFTFNLPSLEKLINTTSSSNTERTFNSSQLLKQIAIGRIKEWLFKNWQPNFTTQTLLDYPNFNNNTIIFHLIQLAKNNISINIDNNLLNNYSNNITKLNSIYSLLNYKPKLQTINSLRNNKILFLEQLLTSDNQYLLPWNNIYLRTQKATRGKKPTWFTKLEHQFENKNMLTTNPNLTFTTQNFFTDTLNIITPSLFKHNKKIWALYINKNQIKLGKIKILNTHYFNFNEFQILHNTKGVITLNKTSKFTTTHYSNILLINCKSKSQKNTLNIQIFIDQHEINSLIKLQPQIFSKPPNTNPTIQIYSKEIELIQNFIKDSNYQSSLISLFTQQSNNNFDTQYFINSSIQQTKTLNTKIGIGWISSNDTNIKFSAAIKCRPNSTRSILETIKYLLLTTPSNQNIHIYTNNSTSIKNINSLSTFKFPNTKINNWDTLFIINHIISYKNLKLTLHKLKTNSNNTFYKVSLQLAKNAIQKPIIETTFPTFILPIHYTWNNQLISLKLRSFNKTIQKIYSLHLWSNLKYLQNTTSPNLQLNFNIINSQNSNPSKFSLRIKIILNNLPTMQNLQIRQPHLYPTSNCTRCNQTEDLLHLLTCSKTQINLLLIITLTIEKTTNSLDISTLFLNQILNTFSHFISLHNISLPNFIISSIQGLISNSLLNLVKNILHKNTKKFFINFSNLLLDWFFDSIWSPRNKIQHEWEKARNITKASKLLKTYRLPNTNINNNNSSPSSHLSTNPSSSSLNFTLSTQKWFLHGYSLFECIMP
jgi:hypothetical protein